MKKPTKSWMRKRLSTSAVTTSELCKGGESRKLVNCNTEESKTIARLESENRPEENHQVEETEEDKVVMMCWENSEGSLVEEPNKETDNQEGRDDNEMQKPKDEEAHVDSTLHTGS